MSEPLPRPETEEIAPIASNSFMHLLKTNWQKYIIDILVIIIGITLSFTVNNWKENREREALERTYLNSLREDITADIHELREIITDTKAVVAAAQDLASATIQDALSFQEKILLIANRPNFVSKDATFTDLRSSGNLQILDDINFKNQVLEYYRFYQAVVEVQVAERTTMTSVVGSYMLENVPLYHPGAKKAEQMNKTMMSVSASIPFQNIVLIRLRNREELLQNYEELLVSANAIHKIILHKLE